ncbi:FecR domain-containing protein [Achromobacter pestifer]|uniref:Protein FecR n=1 Tax=Achromobacter pestifer TaxID=1353889 RepID=A0A6S6YTV1_9BURK|nr:FecR domain-containing protein [Achromobacter pestifer]CAB3637435.1 Protein FecR [Achromobacter pestifer]
MSGRATGRAELPPSVIREASIWFVRLGAEEVTAEDDAACRRWIDASPLHRLAWERVEMLGRQFGQVEPQAGLAVLDRGASRGRRQALKMLSLGLGAGGLAAAGLPWRAWTSDFGTAVGERRNATLSDGSALILNTDSAADMRFDDVQRLVVLRRGELHIASHGDPMIPPRPLVVATPMGRITALGTRFVVRLLDGETWVAVTEGAVRIEPARADKDAARVIEAGTGTYFDERAVRAARPAPHADDWVRGALFADGMRLDAFTDELSRYRKGRLVCDPSVAGLRISGSFPLGDTDRILAAIERALPVRADRYTRYWVVLRAKS